MSLHFEILINQTLEYLPIIVLASPEVAVIKGSIDVVWGMYIHSNIDVRSGVLQYVINGPEMHRWHLSDDIMPTTRIFLRSLPYGIGCLERPTDQRCTSQRRTVSVRKNFLHHTSNR